MIACLYVPEFSLAALLRTDPELRQCAMVAVEGEGARAVVRAASTQARERGIVAGMRVSQAMAIDGEVICRGVSPAVERAAQAALTDVADAHSPCVEDAEPGTVYLDTTGLENLLPPDPTATAKGSGGRSLESRMAAQLRRAADRIDLPARVGVASSRVAATLAARQGEAGWVIPSGEEWRFLAPLGVDLLAPSPHLSKTFSRWGIRTLGDLMGLPNGAVRARLGPEALELVRRARGEDPNPLRPRRAPLRFEESVALDYGLESLESFAFVLRGLLDRLTTRLQMRGFLCGDVDLALDLVDRGRDHRRVTIGAATNEVKVLLTFIRLQLESRPPSAPVESIRIEAAPERLRALQLDLFRPNGPAPERYSMTVARLSAICGADHVSHPVIADSHCPAAYGTASTSSPARPVALDADAVQRPLRVALRALRPPRQLEVFCLRDQLEFVRPHDGEERVCEGRVVHSAGPWRVQGEWWSETVYRRDYYDVQLSDGGVYRLFYDRRRSAWFTDGVYD